jgi:hypothetical protein
MEEVESFSSFFLELLVLTGEKSVPTPLDQE